MEFDLRYIHCPDCHTQQVEKISQRDASTQAYRCKNSSCSSNIFLLDENGRDVTKSIRGELIIMALNGKGVQSISETLNLEPEIVMEELELFAKYL